jgi:hypothetical protein|tara:strand:- start:573 stop:1223 length:651 start_codon:yes stop_codon:yes gene_type:complete
MAKRFTDTDKWKKGFMKSLSTKYKLLWLYIVDDCNHAGVWETDFEVASIRIGSKISENEAIKHFAEQIRIFDNGDKWFVPKFIDFQYGQLNSNSRPHQAVIKLIEKYDLYSIKGVDNIDTTDSPKTSLKRFKKPTTEEIQSYCTERKNNVDSMKFFNFYESNGWKVGKNAMKDWKASIRTWESNTVNKSNSNSKIESQLNSWKGARDIIIQQQLNK